jgi:two-component system response regulator RegA
MWERLDKTTPSVILLDVRLGEDDGTALVAPLKQCFPCVPVIMITADASVKLAVKSLKDGVHDFLSGESLLALVKPI